MSARTLITYYCLSLLFFAHTPAAFAGTSAEVDTLGIAAVLLRDGSPQRAERLLDNAVKEGQELNPTRLATLRGLIALTRGDFHQAKKEFLAALSDSEVDPALHLYLARAQYGLQDFVAAVTALQAAGSILWEQPKNILLLAHSQWKSHALTQAIETLAEGRKRHPNSTAQFFQQESLFWIELGLYQAAFECAQSTLSASEAEPMLLVEIAENLPLTQSTRSLQILEATRMKWSNRTEVHLALARKYLNTNKPMAAALVMETLARNDLSYADETADLFRRARAFSKALHWNTRIEDASERMRHRLALHLEMGQYAKGAAMATQLKADRLLIDDEIRYALAFSLYMNGDYANVNQHLRGIADSAVFAKAIALRQAVETCNKEPINCRH